MELVGYLTHKSDTHIVQAGHLESENLQNAPKPKTFEKLIWQESQSKCKCGKMSYKMIRIQEYTGGFAGALPESPFVDMPFASSIPWKHLPALLWGTSRCASSV